MCILTEKDNGNQHQGKKVILKYEVDLLRTEKSPRAAGRELFRPSFWRVSSFVCAPHHHFHPSSVQLKLDLMCLAELLKYHALHGNYRSYLSVRSLSGNSSIRIS
jgi:hypothetical protein